MEPVFPDRAFVAVWFRKNGKEREDRMREITVSDAADISA